MELTLLQLIISYVGIFVFCFGISLFALKIKKMSKRSKINIVDLIQEYNDSITALKKSNEQPINEYQRGLLDGLIIGLDRAINDLKN